MKTNTMPRDSGHFWEDERCLRCGDKDWFADTFCSNRNKPVKCYERYCPVCGRIITASNRKEVEEGEHKGYVFVHDDIVHDDADDDAFFVGVQ